MRKLSNILDESVWGGMLDRSTGDTIRKEDDVNLLDRDGLYDYLTSHYKNTNSFEPIYNSETFNTIKVPFLIQGGSDGVYLSFKENEVSIPYASPYKVKGLFQKLANEFSLKSDAKTGCTWYIISPKDGSEVTNTFFIDVIDFLIDNIPDSFEKGVKKIIEESAWGEMRKRSAGRQTRKEDDIDVNLLDKSEFFDYLRCHYKCKDESTIMFNNSTSVIDIKLFEDKPFIYKYLQYYFETKQIVTDLPLSSTNKNSYILEKLKEQFHVVYNAGFHQIFPKEEIDVTNKFFIEVLDYTIDTINGPKEIEKL